jgi:hypothetical protein
VKGVVVWGRGCWCVLVASRILNSCRAPGDLLKKYQNEGATYWRICTCRCRLLKNSKMKIQATERSSHADAGYWRISKYICRPFSGSCFGQFIDGHRVFDSRSGPGYFLIFIVLCMYRSCRLIPCPWGPTNGLKKTAISHINAESKQARGRKTLFSEEEEMHFSLQNLQWVKVMSCEKMENSLFSLINRAYLTLFRAKIHGIYSSSYYYYYYYYYLFIYFNYKWVFTWWQWYYSKTQHKLHTSHKITHHARTKHSKQNYSNNKRYFFS